jgi:hypothetical protein
LTKLTDSQLNKIMSAKQYLKVIEQITSVPWVMMAVLWFYTNGLRMSCQEDHGPFKIQLDYWTEERIVEALLECPRLSAREAYNMAAKPVKTFFLNGVLAALSLRKCSRVGIYPDMGELAVERLTTEYMGLYELGNPAEGDIIAMVRQIRLAERELSGET